MTYFQKLFSSQVKHQQLKQGPVNLWNRLHIQSPGEAV